MAGEVDEERRVIEAARETIAALIDCRPERPAPPLLLPAPGAPLSADDAVARAYAKLTEAIAILDAAATGSGGVAEAARTTRAVGDLGPSTSLAGRIPTLQPSDGRDDAIRLRPATALRLPAANLPVPLRRRSSARIGLDDILGLIRLSATSRRTADRIATAQQRRGAVFPGAYLALTESVDRPAAPALTAMPVVVAQSLLVRLDGLPSTPDRSRWAERQLFAIPPPEPPRTPGRLERPADGNAATGPIHQQAAVRLERMEADLLAMAASAGARMPPASFPPISRLSQPAGVPTGAASTLRPPNAGEADVEIVSRGIARVSAPRAAGIMDAIPADAPGTVAESTAPLPPEVEEASVVIIKRPTGATLGADAGNPASPFRRTATAPTGP